VIERLSRCLEALSASTAAALETADGRRLAGDCADALRLELDCPQQSLTPRQRVALRRLSDLLEADGWEAAEVKRVAVEARRSLG
jgi:hypothetical protein